MRLEDIGFYTLSDDRALRSGMSSPLWRCELLLTDRCNFHCPYCRGMRPDIRGTLEFGQARDVVEYWMSEGLKNVRFSGGEPTLWKGLVDLVRLCRDGGVERIAISTNGSMAFSFYRELIDAGANDLSISLDACCAADGDHMAGGVTGAWNKVVRNIRDLSRLTYVTVGMVFTEDNVERAAGSVLFADSLGVSDIRVVPSAQFNQALRCLATLPSDVLNKYPILRYRIANVTRDRNVRKMCESDCHQCWLMLDDMAVAGGHHFPCIIYLREGGDPVGKVGPNMRQERYDWVMNHDTYEDPICREMCLDVCVAHNNRCREFGEGRG